MNILAVGAHPDDIEFGCGGTLIKFAEKGHKIFMLIMTFGEQGGKAGIRQKEQEDAGKLIGVHGIFWGKYKDTFLAGGRELIGKIEDVIAEVRPAFIFCSFPDDTHQDHRHLAQAVISATRYIKNVLFYEGPTSQNFDPHVYVDISAILEKKMAALQAHRSQVMKTNIGSLSIIELAASTANFRGIQGRVQYAEAFQPARLFISI